MDSIFAVGFLDFFFVVSSDESNFFGNAKFCSVFFRSIPHELNSKLHSASVFFFFRVNKNQFKGRKLLTFESSLISSSSAAHYIYSSINYYYLFRKVYDLVLKLNSILSSVLFSSSSPLLPSPYTSRPNYTARILFTFALHCTWSTLYTYLI